MDATKPLIFERGDKLYIVTPVAPFEPATNEVEELAFAEDLKKMAPNENLGWLRGQYVEADHPNANGALWREGELAIKALTPMLMPVTVMHDPRTAVGLIADTKLLLPETAQVARARIDTTLGIWRHRFPDVWEEIAVNYAAGSLMQSMECLPRYYDCADCGKRYPKLPGGAEKANWCEHLRGTETATSARTLGTRVLGNVTFTGTGLIFGSRGATGAMASAHLDVFQEEVAEFHERAHRDQGQPRRRSSKVDIEQKDYEALVAKAAKVDDLTAKLEKAEETATKVPELERKLEETETAKVAAETAKAAAETKVTTLEEQARTVTLAKERLGALGADFTGKLGEFTKGRLDEQAGKLSDEEWDARLKELEEVAQVKRDQGTKGEAGTPAGAGSGDGTFTDEELARSRMGGGGGNGGNGEPTETARRSVVGGLVKTLSGSGAGATK